MNRAARGIENIFRERYGREAIFLPSGRLGLFLAFQEWFRSGDRLLISPVNDDVVFFTILAAGLVPVIAPLDPCTGNLDSDKVDPATWSHVQGVMTTNLYGIPDNMERLLEISRRHGLVLIEDACQALDSRFAGRRIGSFSEASVFSLSKHIPGVGGVLSFSDPGRRHSLLARAKAEIRQPSRLRGNIKSVANATGTLELLRQAHRQMLRLRKDRVGHRIPYSPKEICDARKAGGGLDRFDRWVRIDLAEYRTALSEERIGATLGMLEVFEDNRQSRKKGMRKLLQLGFTPSDIFIPDDCALFKVPLFVRDREAVLRRFGGRGLSLEYIYDPPLDVYATSEVAERFPSPDNQEREDQQQRAQFKQRHQQRARREQRQHAQVRGDNRRGPGGLKSNGLVGDRTRLPRQARHLRQEDIRPGAAFEQTGQHPARHNTQPGPQAARRRP